MNGPKVAVVVPVMGHPVLMDDAIASVVEAMQDRAADAVRIDRLIVINDGCELQQTQRGLAAWRALLGPAMILRSTPNRGLSAARNLGIDLALSTGTPDAIFFLDADNRLARGAARVFGRLLAAHPDAGWFYPEFDFFGRDGHFIGDAQPTRTMSLLANHSEAGSLVRRAVFDAGLRFDETLRRGYEDWDFFLSASEAGFAGRAAGRPMLEYRKRASSMLADSHLVDAELRKELRDRHPQLFTPAAVLAAEAREFPRYALWGVGSGVRLGSDPDLLRPSTGAQLERALFAHFAEPYANAAPPYLVAIEPETEQLLRDCGALRALLWNLERAIVRNGNPLQVVHLDAAADFALLLRRDDDARGKPVAAMIAASAAGAYLADMGATAVRNLIGGGTGLPATRWRLGLPDFRHARSRLVQPLEARADERSCNLPDAISPAIPADELLHDLLLKLAHSRFRATLQQSWEWREPGGAVHRSRSVEPARSLANGGVALPLVKGCTGLDIGFVVPIFSLGGVEKVVLRMSEALRAEGHTCHLFITTPHPVNLDADALAVFASINPFPDPSASDWAGSEYMGTNETSWGNPDELADLEGLLLPMDVVINNHSAALHKIARRLRQKGVITLDHEHLVEVSDCGRSYGPPVLALTYENAYDRILTCSRGLADWLSAHGVPPEKLMPIINAPGYPLSRERVDAILRDRRNRDAGEPMRVLFLSRFDRQKGIEHVVEIYRQLQDRAPAVRLTVAGSQVIDGDRPFNFSDATVNLGPLRTASAVTAALADADVLILPSRYEGLPLVVLEAQRLGVVPVVTDVGAINEAVRQGETGFIVPQSEAVAGTVARILDLDHDRPRLAMISDAAAAASRDWNQTIRPLLRYLAHRTRTQSSRASQDPVHGSGGLRVGRRFQPRTAGERVTCH